MLNAPRMLAIYIACASARFRERCIVLIDVPCMLHLYVHVWVRHTLDLVFFLVGRVAAECCRQRSFWLCLTCLVLGMGQAPA